MSKPLMPKCCGCGGEGVVVVETRLAGVQRVEITGAVTAEKNHPGEEILNRKTKRVKFDSYGIITGKTANRD